MTRAFPRKDFLNLVGGSGLLTALGCAAEDPAPDPTGGAGGMAGAGTGGSSGSAGGGAGGTSGSGGTAGGGAGGTSGASGSAGKGGAGAGGTSGSAGQGGSAGSQAGNAGAGSGGGGAGSGGASGGGQGGTAGNAGGGQGGTQGGTAGNAGTAGGGQGGAAGGGGNACMDEIEAEISLNHMHAMVVPIADIMAGVTKVYNTQGTATHPHYVELTAEDFTTLRMGGTVKKVSCSGGDHEYVLSCGTPTQQAEDPECMDSDMCGGMMTDLCPDP